MAKQARNAPNPDSESAELLRRLLAVNLYLAGANYNAIATATGKSKGWVVEVLKGLPDRRRQ